MDVDVGVGKAADGTRREVEEFGPGEIAGDAVLVAILAPHARLHVPLDLAHGGCDGAAEAFRMRSSPVTACRRETDFGALKVKSVPGLRPDFWRGVKAFAPSPDAGCR